MSETLDSVSVQNSTEIGPEHVDSWYNRWLTVDEVVDKHAIMEVKIDWANYSKICRTPEELYVAMNDVCLMQ